MLLEQVFRPQYLSVMAPGLELGLRYWEAQKSGSDLSLLQVLLFEESFPQNA
ncbi:hypothetical protein D3C72_2134120 [compost metagenome]|nr:hypothetical protein [Variovorax boronicumulans]